MSSVLETPPKEVKGAGRRQPAPPVPQTVRDTGLTEEMIIDLLLKILYVQGARTGQQLMDTIRLPFGLVDEQLLTMQQRRSIEVRGTRGHSRGGYVFDLAAAGRERAKEALESSQYVGAAPIPLAHYRRWVEAQTIRNVHVTRADVQEGFSHIVMADEMRDMLGPAINSARSLFLYGHPGNGKTMIADAIAHLLGGGIFVPYAVDIDGQVMMIEDPVYHEEISFEGGEPSPDDAGPDWLAETHGYDRRFAFVKRPVVVTGGELTLEQLDLQYDRYAKMYQAPFQVKANGGVLIIDDFGRQRVPPRDLLNRWIVPLEKRIDYLTLHTGVKFSLPFDCLLVFSTNLNPEELAEEAFWRRIHYKVYVDSPDRPQYEEIFRRCCAERGIPYDERGLEYIYRRFYQQDEIPPRGCHPRDLLDHLVDTARFMEIEPELNKDLLDRACHSYFLDLESLNASVAP